MHTETVIANARPPEMIDVLARHWSSTSIQEARSGERRDRADASQPGLRSTGHDFATSIRGVNGSRAATLALGVDVDLLCRVSVLIIDDYLLYRENLVAIFADNSAGVATVAWDVESLCVALESGTPNVILLNMATRDSAALLREVFEHDQESRVIVLGLSEDDELEIVACAEAGVAGYHLRKDSLEDLLQLVRRVVAGESLCSPRIATILLRRLSVLASQRHLVGKDLVLTSREDQILRLLDMGLSNREIAANLCIAVHTVKNHVHSVLTKLDARSRAEAVARFRATRTGFDPVVPRPGPTRN